MKKMEISPEIIRKLSTESGKLWMAVHNDGSDNRINGDVILEASGYAGCDYFISTDYRLLKKQFDGIRMATPVEFVTETEGEE